MLNGIKGVFFDLGNTLRMVHEDVTYSRAAKEDLAQLSGTAMTPEGFYQMVDDRYEAGYRKWAFSAMREAGDIALWCDWLLPDHDRARIAANAQELTMAYRCVKGVRRVVPHGEEVLDKLRRRGYRLGIISNLIGELEIDQWLREDRFDRYFSSVTLSSLCGIRKPDPAIYRLAEASLGLPLSQCASVGDNLDRDISGARQAGMACNILFIKPEKLTGKVITEDNRPDHIIHDFQDLLTLLPSLEDQT
ncbi:MAG: HAD family hydrolase [Christensenellales bacterium]